MSYEKFTNKELKEILAEHNCAVPNGAKKADLIELVEAIMAKDEDFVTMQIDNELDIFDEAVEEAEPVVIEENLQKKETNRPSMFSDEWNEYVMAHFHQN